VQIKKPVFITGFFVSGNSSKSLSAMTG